MNFFNVDRFLKGVDVCGDIPPIKQLLKNTISVAWPSIVETFLIALIGLIDTVMVSSLGPAAIAAVGLTNQPKFVGLAFFFSLNTAVSALVARRRGEGDQKQANRVLMQTLIITIGMTVIISASFVSFAGPIIQLAGSEADTHKQAVEYFQIIMAGMGFTTISMVINAAQRGAGNTKISMRTNVASNLVNIVLNYLLIGGNFGFPKLGVKGAAIATVMGSIVACVMSIYSVMRKGRFIDLITFRNPRFDRQTIKGVVNIGSSTLAEQIFLRVGFLLYAIIVAKLGTTAFAAHQIGMSLMSISFSFGDGLSIAAISLVGHNLGADRPDLAKIYGNICQRVGFIFAAILSIVFLTQGRNIYRLFGDDPAILAIGEDIMRLLTVVVFVQITQVVYSSCLRAAGDVKFTAMVSLISVAIVRPGMGFLLTYPLGMGIIGAWLGLVIDQLCRFFLTWIRFRKGRWTAMKI